MMPTHGGPDYPHNDTVRYFSDISPYGLDKCRECGSVVCDREAHDKFHDAVRRYEEGKKS